MLYVWGLGTHDDSPNHALNDAYAFNTATREWKVLRSLSVAGYCWSASAIDSGRLLLAGRADGQSFRELKVVDMAKMRAEVAGEGVIQTTCAPLVQVEAGKWWLISGEPDGKRNRTERVTVISLA